MPSDCISYQDSGYFSKLMIDYLNEDKNVKSLYHRFPNLENFEAQILEKQADFAPNNRNILSQKSNPSPTQIDNSPSRDIPTSTLSNTRAFVRFYFQSVR